LSPGLSLTGEYNDNVAFTRTGARGDLLATIAPQLGYEAATERLAFRTSARADVVRYARETDLDETRQTIRGTGTFRASDHLSFGLGGSYRKDTTLEAQLEATGLAAARSDRYQFGPEVSLAYAPGERASLEAEYRHVRTLYRSPQEIGYDLDSLGLTCGWKLTDRPSRLVLRPDFGRTESERSRSADGGLLVGWTGRVSETLEVSALAGGRYSRIDVPGRAGGGSHRAFVAELSGTYQGETTHLRIGYDRGTTYSVAGEPLQSDHLQLSLRRDLGTRLAATVAGSLRRTRAQLGGVQRNADYADLSSEIRYRIMEHHTLRAGYGYTVSDDAELERNRRAERNRFWVAADLSFPSMP
jgi:hypothetical protein